MALEDSASMHAGVPNLGGLDLSAITGLSGGGDQALGSALGNTLRQICNGRLAEISWFRATWQHGGAATGFSTWTFESGQTVDVMVKVPVGPMEQSWTTRLGAVEPEEWESPTSESLPTPRVVASGEALGGYDLSWLIIEKFRGLPLLSGLTRESLIDLIVTTARFQKAALEVSPVFGEPKRRDYRALWKSSLDAVELGGVPEEDRWREVLLALEPTLDDLVNLWRSRELGSWCHGDVHPGNAMWRRCADGSTRCVLIDLALVHPGHWLEDALYLERQFWGQANRLEGIDPVEALARARSAIGLELGGGYRELAEARRVLMAAGVPGLLGSEGNGRYAHGALEILERFLGLA